MKLAIIGSGVSALEASWHFYQLGASVTLFSNEKRGGALSRLALAMPEKKMPWSWRELVSTAAQELKLAQDLESCPTYSEYQTHYLNPLFEKLRELIIIKTVDLQRVHKSSLNLEEAPIEGSRLKDTFRVVWKQDPRETVARMLEESPTFFEQMGADVLSSLEVPIESYEDFDLVIEAVGTSPWPLPLGPGQANALNESHPEIQRKIFYGLEAYEEIPNLKNQERLAVVGSGQAALLAVVFLKEWLENNSLLLVTTEERAFVAAIQSAPEPLRTAALELLISFDENYEKQCHDFSQRLREWRDLDESHKQKIPMPEEPKRKIDFFTKANVTSLDRLIDRDGLFLTAEKSLTRTEAEEIKTFSVDKIFSLTGFQKKHDLFQLMKAYDFYPKHTVSSDGSHPETGFFTLGPTSLHKKKSYDYSDIAFQLASIEKTILNFFTKGEDVL